MSTSNIAAPNTSNVSASTNWSTVQSAWSTVQSTKTGLGDGFDILLDQTRTAEDGTVMYQVRSTRSRCAGAVKTGTLGGWVVSAENLADDAWIDEETEIHSSTSQVSGHAHVKRSVLSGTSTVSGLSVMSDTHLSDSHVRGASEVSRCLISGNSVVEESRVLNSTVKSRSKVLAESTVVFSEITARSLVRGSAVSRSRITTGSKVLSGARVLDSTISGVSSASGPMVVVDEDTVIEDHSGVYGKAGAHDSVVSGRSIVMDDAEVRSSEVRNGSVLVAYARAVSSTLDKARMQGSAAVVGGTLNDMSMG